MKTATDEPVQIIGRTEIIIEIGHCVMVFPVFVAQGVGDCCILRNDFHLHYGATLDFEKRRALFNLVSNKRISVEFSRHEKDAKYL